MSLKLSVQFDMQAFLKSIQDIISKSKTAGEQISSSIKIKPKLEAAELEAELKALAKDYGELAGKMHVLKDAGLENTEEFKKISASADGLKAKIGELGKEYQNTGEKKSLFRQKGVNLGADLTILSFGVQKVSSDLGNFAEELNKSDRSTGKLIGSLGNATLSILAMMPAIKALTSALPAAFAAGIAAVGTFTAAFIGAVATLTVTIGGFIKAIMQIGTAWESFSRLFKGDNVFDIWADATANLSMGLIDLRDNLTGLGDLFEHLRYQANQFRNETKSLDINSPTLSKDIEAKYNESNASFQDRLKKVLNNTASQNETADVISRINKRLSELPGDDKTNRELLTKTLKQAEEYNKRFDVSKSSGSPKTTAVKEEIKLLNTEEQILKQIADIEKKLAIETLPLQKREFEKQILLLKERIKYLSGDYEKINLSGFAPKTLPDTGIKSRSERGDNTKGSMNWLTESITNLKIQLVGLAAMEGVVNGITDSFGNLFAAFVPPQGADSPLRNFLKSVVTSIITAVQASILAAQGFSAASAVFSFGLSLLKDAPLIAAALIALEAAKGFISGFRGGGYTGDGDENAPAGVVHKGEFVIKKSAVRNLIDNFGMGFLQFLNGGTVSPVMAGAYNTGGIVSALTGKPAGDSFEMYASGEFSDSLKMDIYKNGKKLTAQFNKATRISD